MREVSDQVGHSEIFTKWEWKAGLPLIRVSKPEVYKPAFQTWYGHSEYQVGLFGLLHPPAPHKTIMTKIVREFRDYWVVIYINEILIYCNRVEEYTILV